VNYLTNTLERKVRIWVKIDHNITANSSIIWSGRDRTSNKFDRVLSTIYI